MFNFFVQYTEHCTEPKQSVLLRKYSTPFTSVILLTYFYNVRKNSCATRIPGLRRIVYLFIRINALTYPQVRKRITSELWITAKDMPTIGAKTKWNSFIAASCVWHSKHDIVAITAVAELYSHLGGSRYAILKKKMQIHDTTDRTLREDQCEFALLCRSTTSEKPNSKKNKKKKPQHNLDKKTSSDVLICGLNAIGLSS